MIQVLERVAEVCFVPLLAGGGVATPADMRALLCAGADKVSVNSAAVAQPELLEACAAQNGAQCVVLAIDAKRRASDGRASSDGQEPNERQEPSDQPPSQGWEVLTHGGRRATGREAVAWAQEGSRSWGGGKFLLTSFDQDGTRAGFDLPLFAGGGGCGLGACNCLRRSGQCRRYDSSGAAGWSFGGLGGVYFPRPRETTPAAVASEFRRAGLPVREAMG